MMMRTLFQMLAPAGAGAKLSTLIFHRVVAEPDPLFPGEVHARQFDAICAWLAAWFQVLPLDEAAARLASGTLPARALCITFDDGYADNQQVALPILQRHGLNATFFIATDYLDGGRMWNDSVIEALRSTPLAQLDLAGTAAADLGVLPLGDLAQRRTAIDRLLPRVKYLAPEARRACVESVVERAGVALPDDLMMSSDQVRALHRAGMRIGAHTLSHPILARLSRAENEREIAGSKAVLEQLLGERVGLFAYPNGKPGEDYSPESVEVVRALGFDCAVSTAWGVGTARSDALQLPRFTPWDRSRLRFGLRMARHLWAN